MISISKSHFQKGPRANELGAKLGLNNGATANLPRTEHRVFAMVDALGISNHMFRVGYARNMRDDRGRTIRYRAGRIVRGESPRNFLSNDDVRALNRRVLVEAYGCGQQAPTQEISADAGQSKKAAENWWNAENPMGLTAFVNAYRNNARFAAFARYYLLGHQENDPILEIQLQEAMANIDQAASQLGMAPRQLAAAMGFAMHNTITPDVLAMDGSASNSPLEAEITGEADQDCLTGDLFEVPKQ